MKSQSSVAAIAASNALPQLPAFVESVQQCLSHTALGQHKTFCSKGAAAGQVLQLDATAACAVHIPFPADTQRVARRTASPQVSNATSRNLAGCTGRVIFQLSIKQVSTRGTQTCSSICLAGDRMQQRPTVGMLKVFPSLSDRPT